MGYGPIFEYTDSDGDELGVRQWIRSDGAGHLIAEITPYDLTSHVGEVRLDRAQVVALWSALNQWLCDNSPTTLTQVAPAPQAGEDVWGEAHPCVRCGHAEGVHTTLHGCGAVDSRGECRCTAYRQIGPDCTSCDHPDIDHSPSVGCRRGGCGCAQYTSAPGGES